MVLVNDRVSQNITYLSAATWSSNCIKLEAK